jgi:hypothetical protein
MKAIAMPWCPPRARPTNRNRAINPVIRTKVLKPFILETPPVSFHRQGVLPAGYNTKSGESYITNEPLSTMFPEK